MNLPKAGFWRGKRKLRQRQSHSWEGTGAANSRSIAHTLHSTSSDDGAIATLDSLGSKHDGFHAAGTDLVDGGGIGAGLETSGEGDLTSRGLADTSLDDVSEVDLLNDGRIDVLGLESVLQGDSPELSSGEGLQGSIDGTDGCAGGRNDDNFVVGLEMVD